MFLRQKNQAITLFATAALLLQTLLPFFATYQTPDHTSASQMAQLFGDKILLCTRDGFRFFSWQELMEGKKPEPHVQYQCAVCYMAAHASTMAAAPALAGVVLRSISSLLPFKLTRSAFSSERDWCKFLTRSPPFSFVA